MLVLLVLLLLAITACGDWGGSGGGGGGGGGSLGNLGGEATTSIVYVANKGSDDVSIYNINTTTGVLAQIAGSPLPDIAQPSAIAVRANANKAYFAFVTNAAPANTVTAFRVATDGALLPVPSTSSNPNPAPVGTDPSAVAVTPETTFLYVANRGADTVTAFAIGDGAILTRVPQTGSNTNPVSVQGSDPRSMAIASSGQFLYVANSGSNAVAAFQIGANGLLTLVPPTADNPNPISVEGTDPKSIVIAPNRPYLYVANSSSNNVTAFHIEKNGLLTLVPPAAGNPNPISAGGTSPNAVIASSNGQFLYTANGEGNVTIFSIGTDGLLTLVSASAGSPNPATAGKDPVAVTLSPDGRFLFVANEGGTVSSYTISSTTG
ncbi:MAG: lactonase family protein, partial [Nitrospira sp.]|nr:lactonase family protein [Nitrospira sp.]